MSRLLQKQKALIEAINCLIVNTGNHNLLVPMQAVAEVIHTEPPTSSRAAQAWMLGHIEWRGLQLPVLDFDALQNNSAASPLGDDSRMIVLRCLKVGIGQGFYVLVSQGFPRALRVQEDSGLTAESGADQPPLIASRIHSGEQWLEIPDFKAIEQQLVSSR